MDNITQRLKAYIEAHPFDPGDSDYDTVLDQLYQAYQESHESDPPDIRDGFRELDVLLGYLPLEDKVSVLEQLELRQQVQKLSALEQTLLDMQRTMDAIPPEIIASYKAESERKEPIAIE